MGAECFSIFIYTLQSVSTHFDTGYFLTSEEEKNPLTLILLDRVWLDALREDETACTVSELGWTLTLCQM